MPAAAKQNAPLIFLSAGEASGDHYGAELISALRSVLPGALFTGLGGAAMERAGQRRVVRAEDVAVMGITEILRHIPRILHSYRRLVRSIRGERPDVAVLIDFPDVNFRLAKHLKRLGVPVIWFVSPQLWAWKRRRLRWVQERVDRMLTIFPFEELFYRARGVNAEFVGHPLAEMEPPAISREAYAREHGLDAGRGWIALLPGSRGKEVRANLPDMLRAAALMVGAPKISIGRAAKAAVDGRAGSNHNESMGEHRWQFLLPVASTVNRADLQAILAAHQPLPPIHLVNDARAALLHSRAAAVASGTATVQAAVMGTPFVVVYRVSHLTFRLAKRLVRYPEEIPAELDRHGNLPVGMVNLIAGRRIVPELLQDRFTGERVAAELKILVGDTPERDEQIAALAGVRERLQAGPQGPPILRVRDAVLAALAGTNTRLPA